MNQITLTGAVATDPTPRPGLDNPAVAFRLLVPREITPTKPKVSPGTPGESRADDQLQPEPLYVDVVCGGELALFAACLEFGDHLGVAGTLDHQEWIGADGIRRARWVVVASEVIVLRATKRAA